MIFQSLTIRSSRIHSLKMSTTSDFKDTKDWKIRDEWSNQFLSLVVLKSKKKLSLEKTFVFIPFFLSLNFLDLLTVP